MALLASALGAVLDVLLLRALIDLRGHLQLGLQRLGAMVALLAFLGLTLTIPALFKEGEQLPKLPLRPLLMVLFSIVAFGIALEYLGFAIAIAALVLVAGSADPKLRAIESAGVAAFLVLFSIAVLVGLLGMPLNLWPSL